MNWKQIAIAVAIGVVIDIAAHVTETKIATLFPNTQAILGER